MKRISRLRDLFRYRTGSVPSGDGVTGLVEDAVREGKQRWSGTDPTTSIEWHRLARAMQGSEGLDRQRPMPAKRLLVRPAISFAVVAVILVVFGIVWLQGPSTRSYATARGQQTKIMLADSTEVTLNHTSELIVHTWSPGKPRLVVLRGEAFFHVRRVGTPFTVSTDVGTVKVLGTEFNIRVRDGSLEVGVQSGSVELKTDWNGKDSSVVLQKAQIASCARGEYPSSPGPLSLSDFPGWIHGKFMFYRTGLLSVCSEFESQFDVVVKIDNPRLQHETITGTIDGRSIDYALSTLSALTGSKYRHEKNTYTLY